MFTVIANENGGTREVAITKAPINFCDILAKQLQETDGESSVVSQITYQHSQMYSQHCYLSFMRMKNDPN
nr:unnamed protein product [Callosobruchus chinensis]